MKQYVALLLVLSVTSCRWPGIDNAKAPASAPTALSAKLLATAPKGYSVQLVWNQYPDPTVSSLRVWQGSSAIRQVSPQVTTVVVGGLSYRVQYSWHLTAIGPTGESAPSGTVGYWKQNAQQPGIPSGSLAQ